MVKRGRLKVQRKAYTRKAHGRKGFRKDSIAVKPTMVKRAKVPATTYTIKDIGAKGRSKPPFKGAEKLKKGRMTQEIASVLGYDKSPTDLLASEWRNVFLFTKISPKAWAGMLLTQVARRKYAKVGTPRFENRKRFRRAFNILADVHDLTPRKAIAKWKSMSPKARALAMPERK